MRPALAVAAGMVVACGSGSKPSLPAPPVPEVFTLHLEVQGSGSIALEGGTIGLCEVVACDFQITGGTAVTLLAQPAQGQVLETWAGACSGTGACNLTITADTQVTARFVATSPSAQPALSVQKDGTGDGSVTSAPAGLDCGVTCAATFAAGTQVTLTAAATTGSTFKGWDGGGCSGIAPCLLTLDGDTTVTATFDLVTPMTPPATQHALDVQKAGTGAGTVTSTPPGIDCGDTCSTTLAEGTQVTLTAGAAAGSGFLGWSGGGCSGSDPSCTLTLGTDATVTATFDLLTTPQ